MNEGVSVALPLSSSSYTRAAFFVGMLVLFGVVTVVSADGAAVLIGLVCIAVAATVASDLWIFGRRWELAGDQLQVPRLWSPDRSIHVMATWQPTPADLVRRDSMFRVPTGDGRVQVAPNLLVARSDVLCWFDLIAQSKTTRP